jgi:hypothetical protein
MRTFGSSLVRVKYKQKRRRSLGRGWRAMDFLAEDKYKYMAGGVAGGEGRGRGD